MIPRSEVDTILDMRWYALSAADCHKALASLLVAHLPPKPRQWARDSLLSASRFLPDQPKRAHLIDAWNVTNIKRFVRRKSVALFPESKLVRMGLIEHRAARIFAIPTEPIYDTELTSGGVSGELTFFAAKR